MKYSYMPTEITKHRSTCEVHGSDYFIDSDERTLDFRNQYGEKFVLASSSAVWFTLLVVFIIGFVIGKWI